jgi:hypothetical protein
LERQDSPPRIIEASYTLVVETYERAPKRASLLHKNIRKFEMTSDTLASSCPPHGAIKLERADASPDTVPSSEERHGTL